MVFAAETHRTHGDYQILLLFQIPDVVFIINLLLLVKMPYLKIKSKEFIPKKWKKIWTYMESKKSAAISQQHYSLD